MGEKLSGCQALILAARAGRAVNAEQALQQARQAADLLQPAPDTSDNVSARWWLALALGEQAAACQALGRSAQARTLAVQALLAWGDGTATSPSPPPLLTPLVDDQRRLAAGR